MKTNKTIMYIAVGVMVLGLVILFFQIVNNPESTSPTVFEIGLCALFGAACSNIMLKKGRSGALGWVLGIFLTLIGMLICALIPKKAETMETVPSMSVPPAIVTTNMPKGEPVTVQKLVNHEAMLKNEFGLTHTSSGWLFEGRGDADQQSLWKKPEECVPALKALKEFMDFSQICVVVADKNILVCNTKPKPYGISVGMNSKEIADFIALVIKDSGKQVVQYQGTWLLTL
jgi:hypothetical protein